MTLTGAAGREDAPRAQVTGSLEGEPFGAVLVEARPHQGCATRREEIASELGIQERLGRTAREELLEYLRDRQVLLLLLEDPPGRALRRAAVREPLARAPGVKVLATSRASRRPEEQVVPGAGARCRIRRGVLDRPAAPDRGGRRFVDRVGGPGPTSSSPRRTPESVVDLCRLDGLPLALELAVRDAMRSRRALPSVVTRGSICAGGAGARRDRTPMDAPGRSSGLIEPLEPAESSSFHEPRSLRRRSYAGRRRARRGAARPRHPGGG